MESSLSPSYASQHALCYLGDKMIRRKFVPPTTPLHVKIFLKDDSMIDWDCYV